MSWEPYPADDQDRWSVNMPALIGVVFVLLVGVIAWVIARGDDDPAAAPVDPAAAATSTTAVVPATDPTDTTVETTAAPTTTPIPLPTTTETTAPTTTTEPPPPPPATTAPGAEEGAVLGDLAIPGRPMSRPPCDGAFITILASAIGGEATAPGIGGLLDTYPGSNYLRTDQTCPSLNQAVGGQPIYVVFFGPFAVDSDACAARADGPPDAYARMLSDDVGPDHGVPCA